MDKEVTAKKASALIQTNVKELTLVQRKIINAFIYIAQNHGNRKRYLIPTVLLKEYCAINMKGNNELKEQLRSLLGIVIEFNYLNKDKRKVWEASALVSRAKIEDNSEYTEFEFSECLKEKILKPDMYTPLNIVLIAGLGCKYSIVLYEFLKDYETFHSIPKLELKKFRKLLGLEDSKYREFQNFKKRVLDRAVREINAKTDIACSYKLEKGIGNVYSFIQFTVQRKKVLPEMLKPLKKLEFDKEQQLDKNMGHSTEPDKSESLPCPSPISNLSESHKKLARELFETIGVKQDKALSVVEEYPEDKIRHAMKYTKTIKRKNPAGFFLKSLTEDYVLPVKQGEESSEIEALRKKAMKCYPSGQAGSCGAEYQNNPNHSCYWCPKWEKRRELVMA